MVARVGKKSNLDNYFLLCVYLSILSSPFNTPKEDPTQTSPVKDSLALAILDRTRGLYVKGVAIGMAEAASAPTRATGSDSSSQSPQKGLVHAFSKVIASDRVIKSQQQGEPDLTSEKKLEILSDLLHKHPASFLLRFGSFLDGHDLDYFSSSTDYEVQFRVKELKEAMSMNSRRREGLVKNRRLEAIRILTASTDYFSVEAMRERNPLLYEYYIGQYLSEEERKQFSHCAPEEMSLTAHVIKKLDEDQYARTLKQQQDSEEGQMEEEEEDSTEEEEEGKGFGIITTSGSNVGRNISLSADPLQKEEEKQMMRKEFLTAMHLNFLRGKDHHFDYSSVDHSKDYDNMGIVAQDSEDAYFDSEEPSWCDVDKGGKENDGNMDTG